MFLLLLILACAVPASSRAKVLSTGTFRDPLEKWGIEYARGELQEDDKATKSLPQAGGL